MNYRNLKMPKGSLYALICIAFKNSHVELKGSNGYRNLAKTSVERITKTKKDGELKICSVFAS
jgi:hypothetical protein